MGLTIDEMYSLSIRIWSDLYILFLEQKCAECGIKIQKRVNATQDDIDKFFN